LAAWPASAVLASLAAGCASQTAIPPSVATAIEREHLGRVVELRQSCYYGDLYDDNRKWLLSPRPFAQTHHIVDLEGAPIHPANQRDIIPAGSTFVIDAIEVPDPWALAGRMLTTPRYNTWVYLHPVGETRARLPTERRRWVLVLPRDLESGDALERALDELVAPEGEVSPWLARRRPTVRVAIDHKDLTVGMTVDEMVAALGPPHLWVDDANPKRRIAWYGTREAWLVNGAVAEIHPARPAESPAAP
jgi:hypothetical protein